MSEHKLYIDFFKSIALRRRERKVATKQQHRSCQVGTKCPPAPRLSQLLGSISSTHNIPNNLHSMSSCIGFRISGLDPSCFSTSRDLCTPSRILPSRKSRGQLHRHTGGRQITILAASLQQRYILASGNAQS